MRAGYYTDAYFNHARDALLEDGRHPRVVMQVFQKNSAYLGGMDEAIAILKLCSHDWEQLTVHALYDGDRIEPFEPVMHIEGDYTLFAHLETAYLGVLARRTLITSNVVRVLEAARGKQIIFMPARHDHHRVQTGDGYAAYVAGQIVGAPVGVTTDEQASWWGGKGVGTVPHSLIASYGGNTVLAATKFADWAPEDLNVTVLVDFENDSVETALDVARALGPRLWGVRLDTSENLVDRSLLDEMGDFRPTGVNARLVRKVRDALDADGFEHVKIVASGGFTVEKIEAFEEAGVPVDAYGVGSSLIRGQNDFTADVVMTDGRPSAKVGRTLPVERAARARRLAGRRAGLSNRLLLSRLAAACSGSDARPVGETARSSGRRACPPRRSARTPRPPRPCSRRRPARRPARCSPRAGRCARPAAARASSPSSRSSIVQATQWLFAWPATTTASKLEQLAR